MSIVKSRAIYKGGWDKDFYVDEMTNEHLINVLTQISAKVVMLNEHIEDYAADGKSARGLRKSLMCVMNDEKVLIKELNSRKNTKKEC